MGINSAAAIRHIAADRIDAVAVQRPLAHGFAQLVQAGVLLFADQRGE